MSKTTFVLIVILSAAAFLRFYQIDTNPKAMYGDGLTGVYDAYSIYKTGGYDQKGNFLPLVFSLGGGRPGGYIYASVPFAALFGPTALASRMVSVLSGIGIVFLLFLLGKKFFSEEAGLSMAAVTALNPWELSLSRGPFESHFALFLTLLGFYFFILGFKKSYCFLVFGLAFGLASQTYSTYRLTIPFLTILLLAWIGKKEISKYLKKPLFIFSLMIIFFSTILGIYLTVSRGAQDRFDIINIFKDPDIRHTISQKVKKERLLDSLPAFSYLFHLPHLELGAVLVENYLKNFFPDFLFLHGDGSARHNPAEMGQLLWIDSVLLLVGLVYLYQINKKLLVLLIAWMAVAPIPTSLVGGPHGLRSSLLLPPLLILIGLGLKQLWSKRLRSFHAVSIIVLIIVFIFQYVLFLDKFYFVAPKKQARFWSISAKEAFILAEKNRQKFDSLILSNDIDNMEFAYPTYAKLDPGEVIKQNQSPAKIGEFKFFKYGNVYIGSLPNTRVNQFVKDLPGSVLYIGAGKEQPYLENYKLIRGFDNEVDLVVTARGATPDLYIDER